MPDLGKYAVEVLLAYGVSIVLLIGVVVVSLRRERRVARQLQDVEARRHIQAVARK
ncbi:Heme exporter protein D (CcmD) [Pseudooctadecabacter jejudonensis]|uniref:Heme exporter protein D n=2 Tax=Pseudooctadecabacter jejudonensis TaxID=1391910 RepID=A0A1Y5TFI3_9RHOB|nr:Heme exporter protein D (CcmD) [Pseudooctadecabacter jejudonensis]